MGDFTGIIGFISLRTHYTISMVEISIVASLYNSERFIDEFIERIKKTVNQINCTYEIILVDDGSIDSSVKKAENNAKNDTSVKLIKLSKNFGHHIAMICGLDNAKGKYIFLIDVDLEEQPELLSEFYYEIKKDNLDHIVGVQSVRNKDKILGKFFWYFLNKWTGLSLGSNICTVRIMNRNFVSKFKLFEQKDLFIGELSSHIGLRQGTLEINKGYKGDSSYSFLKKFSMLMNMIFLNSNTIWIKLSFFTLLLSFGSFILFLMLIISSFLGKTYLSGWLSLMVIITLFASINFFFFGLLLQFVSKILEEVRAKPRYIIDKTINFEDNTI